MNRLKTLPRTLGKSLGQIAILAGIVFRFDADGTTAPADLDASFQPSLGRPPSIRWIQSLTVLRDGGILAFGTLSADSIPPLPGLARLQPNGVIDGTYQPRLKGSAVTTVLELRSGKILVGGRFSIAQGNLARTNLARLEADGSLDPTFDAGSVPASTRFHIHESPEGKLLVAGSFTDYQRSGRSGLVRLHPDGRLDETFRPLPYPRVLVETLVPVSDGSVMIMGTFFGTDTGFPVRMARLLSDGSLDPTFQYPNLWIDAAVGAAGPDGTFYVTTPAATESPNVVQIDVLRLLRNGDPDGKFKTRVSGSALVVQPGNGVVNPPAIRSMHRQPDGRLVIAGKFNQVNGVFRRNLARLEADGSLDRSFDPGAGPVNTTDSAGFGYAIESMVPSRDGRIYLAGSFNVYNRQAVPGLIRVQGDPVPRFQGTHGSPTHLHTTWIGVPGERVALETSSDLVRWTPWRVVTNDLGTVSLSLPVSSATFLRATSASAQALNAQP